MTADTKPEAEALLPCPWCRSVAEPLHRPSAVTRWQHRIVCRGTTCGAEGPVEASEAKAVAAWNTRAALSKPSVAPDDEAHFTALQRCVSDSYGDDRDSQQVYEEGGKALEALRRRIAGLRAVIAKGPEADRHVLRIVEEYKTRAETAGAALAACRDKTIEECAAVTFCHNGIVRHLSARAQSAIRALKKDPTNG